MLHDQKTKELKMLPCGAKKKQVFKMYPLMPESRLRNTIHYWERHFSPHLSEKEIKNAQWVSRNVLEKVVDTEGVPAGYQFKFKD